MFFYYENPNTAAPGHTLIIMDEGEIDTTIACANDEDLNFQLRTLLTEGYVEMTKPSPQMLQAVEDYLEDEWVNYAV